MLKICDLGLGWESKKFDILGEWSLDKAPNSIPVSSRLNVAQCILC